MTDVFRHILGQPQVRDFLRAVIASGRVGQSYLFTGPAGSNKTLAAYAFAQAILCPQGGCGTCETCRRIRRHTHPDVRYYAPSGVGGYLIEQVREITSDVMLAPIQAKHKVYILDRSDLLGISAANAFLKTLEEPPLDTVLILLGRTRESVVPTIVSRCQVVPFRHIPPSEAVGIICQNAGVSASRARVALEAADGSLTSAIEFCSSNERQVFRARVLEVMASLRYADDWDILGFSTDLTTRAKAPLDAVRIQQEEELAEVADYLGSSALNRVQTRNKRQLSAKSMESLRQTCAIIRSWIRDVMCTCAGTPELVVNSDVRDSIEEAAAATDEAKAARACVAVARCLEAIAYNVSPQTCFDALLFEITSALWGEVMCPARSFV